MDVDAGTLTYASNGRDSTTREFDLIIGADVAGSVVRQAMRELSPVRLSASAPLRIALPT
jgi:2-polyprenyl-6-methoxyphenol hydroxylase-like FAD-dependent oxidoreductase